VFFFLYTTVNTAKTINEKRIKKNSFVYLQAAGVNKRYLPGRTRVGSQYLNVARARVNLPVIFVRTNHRAGLFYVTLNIDARRTFRFVTDD